MIFFHMKTSVSIFEACNFSNRMILIRKCVRSLKKKFHCFDYLAAQRRDMNHSERSGGFVLIDLNGQTISKFGSRILTSEFS